jgi:hemerythrin-like metal-binding protein
MTLFAWDESLSTRIPHIDEQHRKLVSMINDLDQSVQDGTGGLLISYVLQELIRYVKEHFEDEEQLMVRHNFPELSSHRREHDLFVERLKNIHENFRDGDALSRNVLDFLKDWLLLHIKGTDQEYSEFICGTTGKAET